MYYILKETTDYGDNVPGGSYLFESKPTGRTGQVVGYVNHVTDVCKFFNKPLTIDMRGRTFKRVGLAEIPKDL